MIQRMINNTRNNITNKYRKQVFVSFSFRLNLQGIERKATEFQRSFLLVSFFIWEIFTKAGSSGFQKAVLQETCILHMDPNSPTMHLLINLLTFHVVIYMYICSRILRKPVDVFWPVIFEFQHPLHFYCVIVNVSLSWFVSVKNEYQEYEVMNEVYIFIILVAQSLCVISVYRCPQWLNMCPSFIIRHSFYTFWELCAWAFNCILSYENNWSFQSKQHIHFLNAVLGQWSETRPKQKAK